MTGKTDKPPFMTERKEGFKYTLVNRFALTIVVMNMIWATGGGAINMIFERMGGIHFPLVEGWNPDIGVAMLWTSAGFGLAFGMLIAHRTSVWLDFTRYHSTFIGWTLIIHGVLFSLAGVMPTLLLFAIFSFISPSSALNTRSRKPVSTACPTTSAAVFRRSNAARSYRIQASSYLASEAMYYISPQVLTVISGILSAGAGVLWFVRHYGEDFTLGMRRKEVEQQVETV